MERTEIRLECRSTFNISYRGENSPPRLEMKVSSILDNEFFRLASHNGSWRHDGPLLECVTPELTVYGSRFSYEGEVHPCSGYEPTFNEAETEASFSLDVEVENASRETVKLRLVFFMPGIKNNETIRNYKELCREVDGLRKKNTNLANQLFAKLKSWGV